MAAVSQSWADKVEREQEGYTEIDERTGLKNVVEYEERDGKRYKITKTYRLEKQIIPKGLINRRSWKKFGDAEKNADETNITTEYQDVKMEFITGLNFANDENPDDGEGAGGIADNIGQSSVLKCQFCGAPHYSVKCPLRSLVQDLQDSNKTAAATGGSAVSTTSQAAPGAYVPPGARGGGRTGPSAIGNYSSRDEYPTLRISNLTDNATEDDLKDMVQKMDLAHIKRIHIPKDFDKKRSRGFAYISFESFYEAEKCQRVLNGMKYDHLVLHVEWAKK